MSALVKLYHGTSKTPRYVSLKLSEGIKDTPARNYMGVEVSSTEPLKFKAKEKVVLHLGDVTPRNYHAMISVDPFLLQAVTNVSCPALLEPDDTSPLTLSFTTVDALEWDSTLLRIYLID